MSYKYHLIIGLKLSIITIFFSTSVHAKEYRNCTKEKTIEKDKKTGKVIKETIVIIPCDNPECPVKKYGFK